MPGEYNEYAAGYREVIFPVLETVYGTPVHPAATDAIIIQTATMALAQERVNRADKTTSRSYFERITHRKEVTWSTTQYNLPSGTNGTPPDIDVMLESGFGAKRVIAADAVAGGAATTTVIPVADGTLYEVGDAIGWENAAGEVEVAFVDSIAGNDLTITPPFSAAPIDTAPLLGSVTYKPANQLDWMTITKVLDNIVQVFTGCFVNDISFEFPGTAEGTITIGGMGKTGFTSGVSALGAAALVGDLTLTVTTGHGKRFSVNTRVLISAEGANTDEVVLITAIAGDVLTVTRAQAGTAASAHAIAAIIGPYQPAATVSGSPVSGTVGECIITGLMGATRALSTAEIMSMTLAMTNNGSLRNDAFGTDSASGFQVQKREVTFSIELHLKKETVKLYNQSVAFEPQEIMVQLGKLEGKICAAMINRAEVTIPELPGGGDEDVVATLEGGGYALDSGGNNELFVAYL